MPFILSNITFTFTVEWSGEELNFLDVNVKLKDRQLETEVHTHQVLDTTSCHSYYTSVRKV